MQYREVTPVLGIPLWTAFPPMLVSLALLFAAASITAVDSLAGARAGARPGSARRSAAVAEVRP